MWRKIANFILRFRLILLILLGLLTIVMGYLGRDALMSYNYAQVVPTDNQRLIDFKKFRKEFGEDGNVMVVGVQTNKAFQLDFFNNFYELGNQIKEVDGITEVLSFAHAFELQKNKDERKFQVKPIFTGKPSTQQQVDSIKQRFGSIPFYENLIYNPDTKTYIMAITLSKELLNSEDRISVVVDINGMLENFAQKNNIEMHYSGLPYIRTYRTTKIKEELLMFLVLALFITGFILFLSFRTFPGVFFPLLVVVTGVIWSIGTIVLLGHKITLLTGLIPPLIVVIGIPNCVYLLNKYHLEYRKHGDQTEALKRMIEKIGHNTFFTNLTTAIGFGVFYFTNAEILQEFGIVAGLNIAATFVISLIIIPSVFSYLPPPKVKHVNYLDNKALNRVLYIFNTLSFKHRKAVYGITGIILIAAVGGVLQLRANGYMLDDVQEKSKIYQDLKFFERNFQGVMPFEVLVETNKRNEVLKLPTLKKIDEVQDSLDAYPVFSKPISVVEGIKLATQAYYGGGEQNYRLPRQGFLTPEYENIMPYLINMKGQGSNELLGSFIDSSRQIARISMRMADVGSEKMPQLLDQVKTTTYNVLDSSKYDITFTGTSMVAIEGYRYLIKGLFQSLLFAFILISFVMGYLFRSLRMLFISLVPNLIPLIITAAIMGYFNIPLKPSTVLIFSIAFGISVDYTIHFLAKYRQELNRHRWDISKTVAVSLKETGISMIYTSVVLFFGFIIFTASEFGGTISLGLLTSITLVVATVANLILLPSILLSFESAVNKKALRSEPLIDVYDEEEDIELEKLDHGHGYTNKSYDQKEI